MHGWPQPVQWAYRVYRYTLLHRCVRNQASKVHYIYTEVWFKHSLMIKWMGVIRAFVTAVLEWLWGDEYHYYRYYMTYVAVCGGWHTPYCHRHTAPLGECCCGLSQLACCYLSLSVSLHGGSVVWEDQLPSTSCSSALDSLVDMWLHAARSTKDAYNISFYNIIIYNFSNLLWSIELL